MVKVKMVLNWCILMVLIAVALMIPGVAQAKSIKIWPDELKPMEPNREYFQSYSNARNNFFYAPFVLPSGARITKITYYHRGMGSPASTQVIVDRIKMGNGVETLASGSSTDSTGDIVRVDFAVAGDPTIRSGYRYYIRVLSDNDNSWFMGVIITFQDVIGSTQAQ